MKQRNLLRFISSLLVMMMLLCACADGSGNPDGETTGQGDDPLTAEMTLLSDCGVIPHEYDYAGYNGKAVKSLKICGTDISEYVIVAPSDGAYPAEITAANELKAYIGKTTGISPDVISDSEEKKAHEIVIGHTSRETGVSLDGLANESFTIRTLADGTLVIIGVGTRGTLYGVYEFLESYLGWRFLAEDYEVVYPSDAIDVKDVENTQSPSFSIRQPSWGFLKYPGIKTKLRLNRENWCRMTEEYGGHDGYTGGGCHTLGGLAECGDDQPCLSDPATYETVMKNLRKMLEEAPDSKLISISYMDNTEYCTCPECTAVLQEEGSESGLLIRFTNKLAAELKEEYPKLVLVAEAYWGTKDVPNVTRPAENVGIDLAVGSCFTHTLDDPDCDPQQGRYVENEWARVTADYETLVAWSKITDRLSVYYYSDSNCLAQTPNTVKLLGDMKILYDLGIRSVFLEGAGDKFEDNGFDHMNCWLASRILWNVDMTQEEYDGLINDFMKAYYGEGWRYVRAYFDFIIRSAAENGCVKMIESGNDAYITDKQVAANRERNDLLFANALKAVESDAVRTDHVKRISLIWDCFAITSDYYSVTDLYFVDKEQYEVKMAEWEKKNGALLREMIDLKMNTHIGKSEYFDGIEKMPPIQ